ncbi:MAG: AAA family ATPase, partial [Streptosporangiaceae bacterium]
TGKTTVALPMADLLHRLGYLERGHLVHAMRNDLVGEFIGQTAPKTKRVLDRAMGGVLFIDEAYYLYRAADSRDYGQEAIDILLQVMENERDRLVIILAGYEDRMDEFFSSNRPRSSTSRGDTPEPQRGRCVAACGWVRIEFDPQARIYPDQHEQPHEYRSSPW